MPIILDRVLLRALVDAADSVVIITCAVLLVLFLLQRDGTDKVGFLFAPIIITWLILIAALGIHNVVRHDPSVFKSMGPHYAIKFFLNRKKQGWTELGGILLCITGNVEKRFGVCYVPPFR